MKSLFYLVAGSILAILFIKPSLITGLFNNFERPAVIASERQGNGIKQKEFMNLFNANRPLSSLAKKGHYTVVEVYLDSCAICKKLEAGFPKFLQSRKDVIIQRVHMPEAGIQFSVSGSSQQEMQQQAEALNSRVQSYELCGTPHVEIYDANRQPVVRDSCTQKPATRFLNQWIAVES